MANVYVQDLKQEENNVLKEVLHKGDLVVFTNGDSGVVMALPDTMKLYVGDMGSVVTGNHWGDTFERGTTVAEYNQTHYSTIKKVYGSSEYDILFEIKQ